MTIQTIALTITMKGSQMKTERPPHKTRSSLKLSTLLRFDTAICRVGHMHTESAQVYSCYFIAVEVSVVLSVLVQHWKWRQAKKWREVWFVSWWLRVLRLALK